MNNKTLLLICFSVFFELPFLLSQINPEGCLIDINGDCVPNAIPTAAGFLRINPSARTGGMGETSLAINPDANAIYSNFSNIAFGDKKLGVAANYVSWLKSLGLDNAYLMQLSAFKKITQKSTMGLGMRYFNPWEYASASSSAKEIEIALAYTRKFSNRFSSGIALKYIYSDVNEGQNIGGVQFTAASAIAADISMSYKIPIKARPGSNISFGFAISNLGTKMSIRENQVAEFLPTNLGLGGAYNLEIDKNHSLTIALDINKLLVPSPIPATFVDGSVNPEYDADNNGIADYREESVFGALFSSFGDAHFGSTEELREYIYSIGFEYWYKKRFAARFGRYFEHELKGDRNYLTFGAGIKYNVFGIDISYLASINQRRNPLDNSIRLSLIFDFGD